MRPAPSLINRLPEQYFARMLAGVELAKGSPGDRIIDLGRGNPDLPPPESALEALTAAALETSTSTVHGYPSFAGAAALRNAIADHYAAAHGVDLDPDCEIAVVPGTKTAIMLVAAATAGHGDSVLVPDPGYPDYRSAVALAGATALPLPLDPPGFQPDFGSAPPAALVLLNYPSNPCAVCEQSGTFEAAVVWAHRRGAWVMHDLAYGFLSFDGRRARSVLEVDGARDVAVEIWSPSKVYGMAGWRIGFVVGNSDVVGRVQTLLEHTTAGVWTGFQRALTAALRERGAEVERRRQIYRARRDRLVAGIPGLATPEGTFYAWWRPPAALTTAEILRQARVVVAPGDGFGAQGVGWVRLSSTVGDADLDEAILRLRRLLA